MRSRLRDAGDWPRGWWWLAALAGPVAVLAPMTLAMWPG